MTPSSSNHVAPRSYHASGEARAPLSVPEQPGSRPARCCPAASTATAGLGLLRAEFVRRYDAQQVWVDGVDCCVVPPFRSSRIKSDEEAPPSPKNGGGCCRRRDDPGAIAQPIAPVLFFSPNAVLYQSCGMAPTDGASWVATYARRGYQVVVFNGRGYGRTRGTPAPSKSKADARAVALYLLERCRVPRLLLHGESIGGLAACGTAATLTSSTQHRVALIADRTFSDLRCEAQYLTGIDAAAPLLRLVTGWSAGDTDGVGAFLRAKCAKLVANDCRDHMIPDAILVAASILGRCDGGWRNGRRPHFFGWPQIFAHVSRIISLNVVPHF